MEQANSVEVKRVLKLQLMKNPYDLRGARQLHSILEQYKVTHYICYKIKLTLRPPCFVVEIFLVPGVLAATFEAPIIMKIHISGNFFVEIKISG